MGLVDLVAHLQTGRYLRGDLKKVNEQTNRLLGPGSGQPTGRAGTSSYLKNRKDSVIAGAEQARPVRITASTVHCLRQRHH